MKYSVIIPTFNHCDDLLKPCIESIIKYTILEDIEVLVVANGCTDNTSDFVNSLGEPFKLIWFDDPLGYTRATNEGIKQARGEYIILLNNDCVLGYQPVNQWIDFLLEPFERDSKIGMTGPMIIWSPEAECYFVIFFCAMTKHILFDEIGLLDDIFTPGGGEDTDWCHRLLDKGYKIERVPATPVNYTDKYQVSDFQLFHPGEGTMHAPSTWKNEKLIPFIDQEKLKTISPKDDSPAEWEVIKEKNSGILSRRYGRERYLDKFDQLDHNLKQQIIDWNKYALLKQDIENKYVIDIGANIGIFTGLAYSLGAKQIISIEPIPSFFKTLTSVIGTNPNIITLNKAVTSVSGDTVFMIENSLGSHVSSEKTDITIDTMSISDVFQYIPEDVNDVIIKMDCEGSEYDIMMNTPAEVFSRVSQIYIEIHEQDKENFFHIDPSHNIKRLQAFINTLGFNLVEERIITHWMWGPNGEHLNERKAPILVCKYMKVPELEIIPEDGVTCVISTRNRYYTTLPLCLSAIINQTRVPNQIMIYDDGDHKDLREDPVYKNILSMFDIKGIQWSVIFGSGEGQAKNHQDAIYRAKYPWIWHLDDDVVPEPNVLESLLKEVKEGVGAVSCPIINPMKEVKEGVGAVSCPIINPKWKQGAAHLASNKIEDIFLGLNEQWFRPLFAEPKEVDHLYSCYLFRRSAAEHGYCKQLTRVGHREETMFLYEMKRKGWKIILTPHAVIWHFDLPTGGVRDDTKDDMFIHDDMIFKSKLFDWGIKCNKYFIGVLNNGIGDHFAFLELLPEIRKKYDKIILGTCYPEVFEDCSDVNQISIAEMQDWLGDCSKFDVYTWMANNGWNKTLTEAYKKMYNI